MIGYKGFNSDMTCMNKQYEVGKIYHEDETVLYRKGMHFCTDPLDVFEYYIPMRNNRYCLVEADNVSDEKAIDSNRVCKDLKIIKEFTREEYYNEICRYHNSKNGIIKKYSYLHIFSNNNIYNIKQEYYRVTVYGNNNIICDKESNVIFKNWGNNNIILKNKVIVIDSIWFFDSIFYVDYSY